MTLLFVEVVSAKPILHVVRPLRGTHYTVPIDISANGRVLALNSETTNFLVRASRQVRPRRSEYIPLILPVESATTALSADGSVVVGWTYNAAGLTRGYRWTRKTGTVDLSIDPDLNFHCSGVSGDGEIVVGSFLKQTDLYQPFFWSAETGLQPLNIFGYDGGNAFAASHDGAVIVGSVGANEPGSSFACRWVDRGLPEVLDPTVANSYATAITPDGSIVIGGADQTNGTAHAFYWARSFGMQWVEPSDAYRSLYFSDVSADASRIVGSVRVADDVFAAILWTPDDGVRELDQVFASVLPRGARFVDAVAISADGRCIAGTMVNAKGNLEGFVLDMGRLR